MNGRLMGLSRCLLPLLLVLAGCASHSPPLVLERSLSGSGPSVHLVSAGETLYSIALRYDKDYHELARLNGLDQGFTIHPGQRLHLTGSPVSRPMPSALPVTSPVSATKPVDKPVAKRLISSPNKTFVVKSQASVSEVAPNVTGSTFASASLAWVWPVKGAVMGSFGAPGLSGKGLDIAGKRGDSVLAAAAGTVVYAGSGLVGYGRMLILRHDEKYISAYAHNDRFLVKEGDRVTTGQAIAVIGSSGTDREKLHFEIRESGKPVDPLRFLPAR